MAERGQAVDRSALSRVIDMVRANERPSEVLTSEITRLARGGSVKPKTAGQKRYVDAIATNIVTFGIGPAGTGKSWLAVAMAVQALHRKEVERIVLTRPAVEAGERLGFLPGDLMAKVDPYLRPLYDALYDMVEAEGAIRLLERGTVEVAPLAFMRGRTLNRSFIILDEAQNTTPRADEDVPDPHRVRVEGRRHRRRHPDRRRGRPVRRRRPRAHPRRDRGPRVRSPHQP